MDSPVTDAIYMARALQLARRGRYTTMPNPMVGCVIVKSGQIIGEGWHLSAGGPHAEIMALRQAGENAKESEVYLTLEPCTHHGRTPPCTDSLIAAGVARVVIATRDPNPLFRISGVSALENAGIRTNVGLEREQAYDLNRGFFTRMLQHRPWIRIKSAISLDGCVAPRFRKSRWISGEPSRRDVQFQRARCGALLTGSGTVIEDNPRLTLRLGRSDLEIDGEVRQPLRVVVDGSLKTSPDAEIYRLPGKSIVATCRCDTDEFTDTGVEVWQFHNGQGRVPLGELLGRLADLGINELQIESGPGLVGALIEQGLYDEILLYIAPCLLGGDGVPLASLGRIGSVDQREKLVYHDVRKIGDDLRVVMRRESGRQCLRSL